MRKSLHTKQNEIFLSLLREQRHAHHVRQADLAHLLTSAQATVSKVERGERRLDIIELRDWLAALGIDFLFFMRSLDEHLGNNFAHLELRRRTLQSTTSSNRRTSRTRRSASITSR
jgi:transcriptional regulator with XRE-family HTH domain